MKTFAQRRRRKKERKQLNRRIEGHRPHLEALEDRSMLTLLGVTPDFPITTYDSVGTVDYDATAQTFDLTASPLVFLAGPPSPTNLPRPVLPPNGFDINIEVDNSGNLIGGVAGDDLTLSGTIDIDGDSIPDVSGTLLTGEVTGFGFLDTGSTTDQFDFTFTPTGGAFVTGGTLSGGGTFGPYFDGKDIAVTTSSEASNFVGDFTVDFTGGAKGNIGTTPGEDPVNPDIDVEKHVCVLEPGDPVMHVVNFDADADGNALPAGTIV
ncbi:MAG: hypothetical protein DWQ46_20835, partial [Planctomycetota bacterium]